MYLGLLLTESSEYVKDSLWKGFFLGLGAFATYACNATAFYAAKEFILRFTLNFNDFMFAACSLFMMIAGLSVGLNGISDYPKAKRAFISVFKTMRTPSLIPPFLKDLKYLEELKAKGLYDNSLIVIVSDHDAHPDYLGMEGKISREIPIYIVNGGIDNSNAWTGECNQLDVYTTILDMMGIQSKWHGLGHTLLNKNYQNSVTEDIQELSDWIIYSDYFNNKDIP